MTLIMIFGSVCLVVAAITLYEFWRQHDPIETSKELGLSALSQVHEWAKWMAIIQTSVAGGLVALLFKDGGPPPPTLRPKERCLALAVFVVMGFALFCSAWILASLPSQALRLKHDDSLSTENDVYEKQLFAWLSTRKYLNKVKLGYMMTLQHWLWALGVSLAGALFYVHLY